MRIDVHRTFIIAVCSWALAASPVRADVTRFDLAGIVRDTTGAVLPGVTVSVKNVDTGFTRSTVTDSEGRYSFTALPPTGKWTITAELQGFQHYAWVTTAYLLTSTAVVPISGKLSDMYGRKFFLLGSSAMFVLTSALCGLSQDMTQLIVFRGLQGIAGGVLTSTVFTVISQIFPPAERGRIQGVFSGIFGLASIVGPLLGGYLTDNLSWRWVFYVNLPVGLIALTVLWFSFPNIRPVVRQRRIDFLGAGTLVAGVVPLLLALSWGGNDYPWNSPTILGLFAIATVMLVLFVFVESRAPEPIIPLSLFRNSIVSVSVLKMSPFFTRSERLTMLAPPKVVRKWL